ncbi:MAG: glucose-1-phosphate cytidylyltransferase [Flavobacteriaceae bacterium]|nr:glucose-1-phosphate cytidylyltransferase [Flavobacteriaceae bacterium]
MKAVILAGGFGTRISEETILKPKPMVEIGGKPILWHIMKIYSHYGINEFIICCGYKGYMIKEYFANYFLHQSDITFDMSNNEMKVHEERAEPWKITLIDTGENTMTGGRIKRIKDYIDDDFCLTYGDGVANINISELIKFHKSHGKTVTLSSVFPQPRFGSLNIENNQVKEFLEKPRGDGGLINGGFFVINKKALELIVGDNTIWEQEPLNNLANNGELMAFRHEGFWQPMDTLRDKNYLEELWESRRAPWKLWS